MWNRPPKVGYRYQKYLPFETIDDLIDQFNYVGYHDVCIYPPWKDMAMYPQDKVNDYKGLLVVHPGHSEENQTGNYKKSELKI